MIWDRIRRYFERTRKWYMGGMLAAIVVVWLLSSVVQALLSFEKSMAITITMILFFIFLILDNLISIKGPDNVEIYKDEDAVAERIKQYFGENKVRRIRLIEYSTRSIRDVWLHNLITKVDGVQIELLMCHRETGISDHQKKNRICIGIKELFRRFEEQGNLKIVCYKEPASIRGRNFDDKLIVIGWYTYRIDEKKSELRIQGHSNPLVVASVKTEAGVRLRDMFNETFQNLWKNGTPLETVCNRCSQRESSCPSAEWLKKTNPFEREEKSDEAS